MNAQGVRAGGPVGEARAGVHRGLGGACFPCGSAAVAAARCARQPMRGAPGLLAGKTGNGRKAIAWAAGRARERFLGRSDDDHARGAACSQVR
jgi:hypothetical protein